MLENLQLLWLVLQLPHGAPILHLFHLWILWNLLLSFLQTETCQNGLVVHIFKINLIARHDFKIWKWNLTWARDPGSTAATITGASPRTLNPNPESLLPVLCSWILRGTVQWCLAENIATGPKRWNKSSTGKWAKSGAVNDNWNLDEAVRRKKKSLFSSS